MYINVLCCPTSLSGCLECTLFVILSGHILLTLSAAILPYENVCDSQELNMHD